MKIDAQSIVSEFLRITVVNRLDKPNAERLMIIGRFRSLTFQVGKKNGVEDTTEGIGNKLKGRLNIQISTVRNINVELPTAMNQK
ncbi:hypothetical protein ACFLXB_09115 [Chloroflexota bacterium]